MSWIWLVIVFSLVPEHNSNSISQEDCNRDSKERHCHIEYRVKDLWPHTIRWRYGRLRRDCVQVYYAKHCGPPKEANNFATKEECENMCAGYM
ncbi:hypothetical protein NE865_13266 [Phthorimaea operculella]|nr:hypothetical protein NE865_13266 [Phthorimaea operculella]